ncbi:ArpU family transcriptional regulator [Bacillus sp. AFS059628]|nr:ArpU family transcriptional regulator [Bacillus sp. AFS059628]
MERQLTLLPAIDDKKVQKEVVSVLKEYRALKMRFSNDVEQEGISLYFKWHERDIFKAK